MTVVIFEIFLVPYFVPTISMQTPQEAEYMLPWTYTIPFVNDSSVRIDLEVYNLIYPDKVTPWVNDVIAYSFNITNLTNQTLSINHTIRVVSPISEQYVNMNITLDSGATKSLDRERVTLKSEGVNEIDVCFNIADYSNATSPEKLLMEHYLPAITPQFEINLLFAKYGQTLTLIVLIPSTIIAIKNLKDLGLRQSTEKRPNENHPNRENIVVESERTDETAPV
ncbi:hypothetical protein MUP77_11545 [Candidatus Bathyarchaeota archaeon]|nr:hypothetical protein [Candidatus Bathyarchaeota archaeon]